MAGGRAARGGVDVLRRARHLPEDVLRVAQTRASSTDRPRCSSPVPTTEVEPVEDHRRGQGAGGRGAGRAGVLRAGPWSDQRARQDARDGAGRRCRRSASLARIFREAGVARAEPRKKPRSAWRRFVYPAPNACWQLDATEYVLSRRPQVRDLPAHRRPLPLRGRLPRRVRRDRQGRDRGLRQGDRPPTACRNDCCPTTGSR